MLAWLIEISGYFCLFVAKFKSISVPPIRCNDASVSAPVPVVEIVIAAVPSLLPSAPCNPTEAYSTSGISINSLRSAALISKDLDIGRVVSL
jgi:hypothetical protein